MIWAQNNRIPYVRTTETDPASVEAPIWDKDDDAIIKARSCLLGLLQGLEVMREFPTARGPSYIDPK